MKTIVMLAIGGFLVCAVVAMAGDNGLVKEGNRRSITLPTAFVLLQEGSGMDTTSRYCRICHSLDYIITQPKFPKARWQAEVTKMIKTYGAPIPEGDARIITEYIAAHYGTGK